MLLVMFLCFSTTVKAQKLIVGEIYSYEVIFPSDFKGTINDHILFYVRKDGVNPEISFVFWDKEAKTVYIRKEVREIPNFYTDADQKDCVNQNLIPVKFDSEQIFTIEIEQEEEY